MRGSHRPGWLCVYGDYSQITKCSLSEIHRLPYWHYDMFYVYPYREVL